MLENGAVKVDLHNLHSRQEERFNSLESVIKDGFNQVAGELKSMREQGHIPVDVVNKIIEALRPVIRFLCLTIVLLVIWFTGVKAIFPEIFNDKHEQQGPRLGANDKGEVLKERN